MKALDSSLILAKNRLTTGEPWIYLLIVEVDDDTTVRWAVYPEDVIFDGDTYTALPAFVEAIRETNQGRFETLTVHVANAGQVVSAYLENAQLLGKSVTVRVVWADAIDNSEARVDFEYRIDSVTVNESVASFTLGRTNLMALRLPRQRFIRTKCRHRFRDARCQYPGDDFQESTYQDLYDARSTGSPFEKLHGWSVLNPHECSAAEVDADYLTITNATGAVKEWYDASYASAFVYKSMSGGFNADTLLVNTAFADNDRWAYWIVQESASPTNWIAFAWVRVSGVTGMRVLSTVSGTTTVLATTTNWWPYAKLIRYGTTWVFYYHSSLTTIWTTLHTLSRTLTDPVRIGFTHSPRSITVPSAAVSWDYLHFTSGGLTTCDMTLDGDNGCRAHYNTTRFGGAPALPRGRII